MRPMTSRAPGRLHSLDEPAEGAHPVRAFNTLGFENFAEPTVDGATADLFYAFKMLVDQ